MLQFTQESFEVNEGRVAGLVCVEIANGIIIRDIPFSIETVLTSSSTAEGIYNKYYCNKCVQRSSRFPRLFTEEDFVSFSEPQLFEIQTQTQTICTLVRPNNDVILEDDESFSVTIVAGPPVQSPSPRLTATVVILNDDGKNERALAVSLFNYNLLSASQMW